MQKVATGVYERDDGRFKVRVAPKHPETGERLDRQKTLPESVTTVQQAKEERKKFMNEVKPAPAKAVDNRTVRTVADYATLWYERKAPTVKPMVARNYCRIIDDYILDFFEHVGVGQVTRSHVLEWVSWADELRQDDGSGYAATTRRGWWNLLKQILLDMKAELGLDINPVARVTGPSKDNGNSGREQRTLSAAQLREFVDAAEQRVPTRFAEILMLSTTGCRVGEAHGLMWECVHWEDRALELRRSASKGVLTETTKTGYGRTVAMTDRLASVLREHRKESLSHEGIAARLVFPSTNGKPRYSGSLRKAMNALAESLGYDIRVGPQVIRRTVNTLLVESGVSEYLVRSQMGHRSPEMTELYAGFSVDQKHDAVSTALDGVV